MAISARVPPDIKAAFASPDEAQRKCRASMLGVMVLDYCRARERELPRCTSVSKSTIFRH